MQRIGDRLKQAGAIALTLALAPAPLLAQSANDWSLPGATVRPAPPGSQGPVDPDNPLVTTTAPRPTQTAAPSPSPSATSSPTASAAPVTSAAPPRTATSARQPAPRATSTTAVPDSGTTPPATAAPTASPFPVALPTATALPTTAPTPVSATGTSGWYWPWITGAATLLALAFAGLWWRRRSDKAVPVVAFERPVVQAKRPASDSQPETAAQPAPPQAEPVAATEPDSTLGITLEARRMNASLMATSLNYVLRLTNHGAEPLSALAVEGEMISAHASLPPEAQITNENQRMEPRHNLVTLAPGESAEFTGIFMLPLTAVIPIRAGDAAYFVPLARLRVEASTPAGGSVVQAQTWVVGELPEDPASALRPFRLDLGPRTYSRVGQRSVN